MFLITGDVYVLEGERWRKWSSSFSCRKANNGKWGVHITALSDL